MSNNHHLDLAGPIFITKKDIIEVPQSNWYKYKLFCKHEVYTRVRLTFRFNDQQHFIRCPKCDGKAPTAWSPIELAEAVTDEHVSNVLDGSSFVLPRRILRTDGPGVASGNPFPYTTKDREY